MIHLDPYPLYCHFLGGGRGELIEFDKRWRHAPRRTMAHESNRLAVFLSLFLSFSLSLSLSLSVCLSVCLSVFYLGVGLIDIQVGFGDFPSYGLGISIDLHLSPPVTRWRQRTISRCCD